VISQFHKKTVPAVCCVIFSACPPTCKLICPLAGPIKVKETCVHFEVLNPSFASKALPPIEFHAIVLFTTIQKLVAVPSLTQTPTVYSTPVVMPVNV